MKRDLEKTKTALIDAAEKLFKENGIVDTTVNAIVKELDVAKGLFYYYFKSKDDVIDAISEKYNRDFKAAIQRSLDNGNDFVTPKEQIEVMRKEMRKELGVKDNELMFLYVGQHIWEKNWALMVDALALVKLFLTTGNGNNQLGQTTLVDEQSQRHNRETWLLSFPGNAANLLAVQQEFAVAFGGVVKPRAKAVFGDVHLAHEEFVAYENAVGVGQVGPTFADRLDLCSRQHHSSSV
jgi:AcrR family transcriptional regulator